MESGLYVTFFDRAEAHDRELPPVGPLDHVVLQPKHLVAERTLVQQAQELGVSIDRWLEAEIELQRATGEEPGGVKRPDMRVAARDGVFVRFAVFGDARERDIVPEAGPFAVVVVGPRSVEGDGQLLATRAASELAPWEIASGMSADAAGQHKPDIAFRASSGGYHAQIAAAPPSRAPVLNPDVVRAAPAYTPPPTPAYTPPTEPEPLFRPPDDRPRWTPSPDPVYRPPTEPEPLFRPPDDRPRWSPPPPLETPAEEPDALTAEDLALIERIDRDRAEDTLRARVQEEERRRLGVDESADDESATTWSMRYRSAPAEGTAEAAAGVEGRAPGELLWRLRFVLIGILLMSVGLYTLNAIRTGTSPVASAQQQSYSFVGVGSKVSGTRWEWVVNGVQRSNDAGSARPAGVFYVVRVGATNKGTDGAQLSPSDFTLVDANGVEHPAASLGSGVYQGQGNTGSPNVWPQGFPVGRTTNFNVVFDIDPGLGRGMLLGVSDLPKTRIRLD